MLDLMLGLVFGLGFRINVVLRIQLRVWFELGLGLDIIPGLPLVLQYGYMLLLLLG